MVKENQLVSRAPRRKRPRLQPSPKGVLPDVQDDLEDDDNDNSLELSMCSTNNISKPLQPFKHVSY